MFSKVNEEVFKEENNVWVKYGVLKKDETLQELKNLKVCLTINKEITEETLPQLESVIEKDIMKAFSLAIEDIIINGDTSIKGENKLCICDGLLRNKLELENNDTFEFNVYVSSLDRWNSVDNLRDTIFTNLLHGKNKFLSVKEESIIYNCGDISYEIIEGTDLNKLEITLPIALKVVKPCA